MTKYFNRVVYQLPVFEQVVSLVNLRRQQLLEARSVEARLGMVLRALRKRRRSIEAGLLRKKKGAS